MQVVDICWGGRGVSAVYRATGCRKKNDVWCKSLLEIYIIIFQTSPDITKESWTFIFSSQKEDLLGQELHQARTPDWKRLLLIGSQADFTNRGLVPQQSKKKTQLGKKNGRIFVEIWLPEFFLVKLTASVSEDPDFSCLMLFILASNFSLISSDRKGFLVASGRMWFSQLRRSLFSAQTILCQNLWRYFADRKNVSNQKMCESFCPVEIKVGMALGCPKSSSSWAAQRFWGPKMKWLVNGTQNMGSLNHPNLPSGQGTQLNLYHVFCYVDRLLIMKHSE